MHNLVPLSCARARSSARERIREKERDHEERARRKRNKATARKEGKKNEAKDARNVSSVCKHARRHLVVSASSASPCPRVISFRFFLCSFFIRRLLPLSLQAVRRSASSSARAQLSRLRVCVHSLCLPKRLLVGCNSFSVSVQAFLRWAKSR